MRLDRADAADRSGDARHRIGLAGAVDGAAVDLGVDAAERRCEAVRIAFAAHLAVADEVDPRLLLIADGDERRRFLRVGEPRFGDTPQLALANARRQARLEALAVDEPVGLRIAADDRRR